MKEKLYIYIDESGDTGVKFETGSSELFIISIVIINADDLVNLNRELEGISNRLLFKSKEFKFSKILFRYKVLFFKSIYGLKFKAHAFIFTKHKKSAYINYLIQSLREIRLHEYSSESIVTIDGTDKNMFSNNDIKAVKNLTRIKTKIVFCDSEKSNLLQLSDMIAGLVHAVYKNKGDYFDILKALQNKIKITRFE